MNAKAELKHIMMSVVYSYVSRVVVGNLREASASLRNLDIPCLGTVKESAHVLAKNNSTTTNKIAARQIRLQGRA